MFTIRRGRIAFVGLCLLITPFLSFAQTETYVIAATTDDNVATVSLERAVARVTLEEFAPLSSLEGSVSPDRVLLAQTRGDAQNPPQPPPANPGAPTLGDLGIAPEQTQGSAQDQARLDKRSHMLKMHQRFGLITLAPLIATIATSGMAAGKHPTAEGRDIHGGLGAFTADMYFMTAYYALRAPRIPGTTVRGPIRLHKVLAWIHGPGMILTPILGAMAFSQESQGEKVHGIAKIHSAVADVTYTAFGLAILSVSIKF
jgi:hypothetical protein